MRFVFLPNKIELIASIEFGNRTHRKVPVRSCSITEPIEQQSDRLGSIDFWFVFVALTTPGVFRSKSFKLLSLNLSLTHLRARIACYEFKGDLSPVMLKEIP